MIEIEKFRTRFCEYHKIEKQKLDDFSKELNFKLITVDNEYWCAQSMFTLSGCYSITSKKGKEPSKVFVDEVEKEEEVIKSKLDAISKFAKEHKMKFYVPNNDIYFTLFCEHTLETEVERTDSNDPTKSEITKETTTSKE
ncbi:hypothetical protein RB653_004050 [Dictyostelium firmibasis]|uniref:Uncharacterized protein n=1 Tax=Dictyostelium firmibasis TaxID=79012 RepID=A0AAN7U9X4_9MYCE